MIRLNCDYLEGAHPRILERLAQTNMTQTPGYGEDEFCQSARALLRQRCQAPGADVHFLVGGTQTNLIMLAAVLKPYQGVLAAETAHIATHETGAIEAGGHKVLALPAADGKITAEQVAKACLAHFSDEAHEHLVMPGALYISQPTELGTLYSRAELQALREVSREWNLTFYIDGARLGYGMAAPENDVDLPCLAQLCDAFYIGGTKQGALFGEALLILKDELKRDFRYLIKQRGAMLAKGRLLGIQFDELFRDGLYEELSRHAVALAKELREALTEKGYPFLVNSPTNQLVPILPDAHLDALRGEYAFSYQCRVDESHSAVRFCTSWATRPEDVRQLIADLRAL